MHHLSPIRQNALAAPVLVSVQAGSNAGVTSCPSRLTSHLIHPAHPRRRVAPSPRPTRAGFVNTRSDSSLLTRRLASSRRDSLSREERHASPRVRRRRSAQPALGARQRSPDRAALRARGAHQQCDTPGRRRPGGRLPSGHERRRLGRRPQPRHRVPLGGERSLPSPSPRWRTARSPGWT